MKIRRLTDTGEWTTRRYLSLLGTILIWIIVAIDAWFLWPTQLGGDTSIVVVSGKSMEPTYFGGDLVIARKMSPSVGDIIVYAPEGLGGAQIVHRIIGGTADEGWQMQGDNNDFVDPFTPQGAEVKGVVLVHYSNFGRVTVLLLNPMVWAFVLLAAMVLMLWYTGDDCEDDDDDETDDRGEGEGDPESEAEYEPDLIDRGVEGTEAAVARMAAAGVAAGVSVRESLARRSPAPRHAASAPRHVAPAYLRATPAYLRGSAIVAMVGLLAIFSPSIASASQLTVTTSGQVFATTLDKCGDLTLSATTSSAPSKGQKWFDHVSISGVTAACAGLPITVSVYANNGDPTQTASGTSAEGSQVFGVQEYHSNQVNAVVVKIDGWLFLAPFSANPPPPAPALSCVALNNSGVATGEPCSVSYSTTSVAYNPWPILIAYDISFTVSTNAAWWSVAVDLAHPDLPQLNPTTVHTNGNPQTGSCSGGVFTGFKNTVWNSNAGYLQIRSSGTYGTQLCP